MSRSLKLVVFGTVIAFSFYLKHLRDISATTFEPEYITSNDIFKLIIDKKKIGLNEVLTIEFIVKNDQAKNFTPPDFKNFNIVEGVKQNVSNTWVDGERSYSKSYTYGLMPSRLGIIKIDIATIKIGNQIYQTLPSTVEVTSSTKLDFKVPKNGFSPYDDYFGKGIYNNSTGNKFIIKNSNSTDAVVLLVNAYSDRKVRNEYIRKGSTFSMTGVPNGTYYLEWASGNNWSPYKKVGNLTGGFQSKSRFTKTRDRADWMAVSGYQEWTVTLYAVEGGDVESESLTENEFGN